MHTVIIASTVPLFRSGLRILLKDAVPGLRLVETTLVDETLAEAFSLQASLIIAENELPGGGAQALLDGCRRRGIRPALLLFSFDRAPVFPTQVWWRLSIMLASENESTVVQLVRDLLAGRAWVTVSARPFIRSAEHARRALTPGFTPTEEVIVEYLGKGMTSRQIAAELFISPRTVQKHREHIARKLGLSGSNALLTWSLDRKNSVEAGNV